MMKKLTGIFIALNAAGCAVSLFIQSGLGSDPIGVLVRGISNSLNIRYGNANLIYNLLIIAIAAVVALKNVGMGTVLYSVCLGYIIDFYNWVFEPLQIGQLSFIYRLILFVTGVLLLSTALAMLINFKLGMNALDAVIYKLNSVTKIPYSVLRTGCDILFTIIGVILGGVFGIGTVIAFVSTGFLVSRIVKLFDKLKVLFMEKARKKNERG